MWFNVNPLWLVARGRWIWLRAAGHSAARPLGCPEALHRNRRAPVSENRGFPKRELLMSYAYPAEKFAAARQALTLSSTQGEPQAVVSAFHECRAGLHRMNRSKLDENARSWIYSLECFMDTEGLSVPAGESAWTVKATSLSSEQKLEIAQLVDDLANWFKSQTA
jgi:hypothetical protein